MSRRTEDEDEALDEAHVEEREARRTRPVGDDREVHEERDGPASSRERRSVRGSSARRKRKSGARDLGRFLVKAGKDERSADERRADVCVSAERQEVPCAREGREGEGGGRTARRQRNKGPPADHACAAALVRVENEALDLGARKSAGDTVTATNGVEVKASVPSSASEGTTLTSEGADAPALVDRNGSELEREEDRACAPEVPAEEVQDHGQLDPVDRDPLRLRAHQEGSARRVGSRERRERVNAHG